MDSSSGPLTKKRTLPKLMACMTKNSLEAFRSKALFSMAFLDSNGVRRKQYALHECLIMELKENGFSDAAGYLQDLIYDNVQLVNEDDIGIVVDLRKREDYLEHISDVLQKAEEAHENDDPKKECLHLLNLALFYAEKEKGILWLAEKFFQASIAVGSQYLVDGGRLKSVCKYHYGKFLLDKFPGADPEEPFALLTEVRDAAIGKDWLLYESEKGEPVSDETVFGSTALQLFRVLVNKARSVRKTETPRAERLARLAERRAKDAGEINKTAEAIVEIGICQLMMNNLNNAQKTLERAYKIHERSENIEGLCEVRMHMAAVMQRLGEHEAAAKLLTEMGASAMKHGLRRHLGRALHLLGELHLRRERPELGTEHLAEAFLCFMGFHFQSGQLASAVDFDKIRDTKTEESVIYGPKTKEIFEEEAEQSRLMTAISAGQELMASYFSLLKEAGECSVAKMKIIEWKLSHTGWWIKRQHHDFIPCLCPAHNRSPLDVLWLQLEAKLSEENNASSRELGEGLVRTSTIQDIMLRHSSYRGMTSKSIMNPAESAHATVK
ncbi:hypothetical protein PYW08_015468 [Mythimna loreyi]|uniref:Uncharacterized protein n=1 Tax=Mythimna loreyi TaxID=667449 RepID=A0ACC2QVX7_9NEOP|nr:hypothetical protein PYW08_015468 [Mythimna loreyi]